ncbi:MAG TPA: hypothetical protein VH309_14835 [Elusimicrobiota bacterium]|jgi:hypothetical protein|nr:hypothetical protein [Elusimicrobiota bacterium]
MNMFDKLLARIQAATLAARHRPRKKARVPERPRTAPAVAHGHTTKRGAEKAPAKPKHRKGRAR